MKYRPFGSTGFQISEIGFGCGDNGGLMVEGDVSERRAVVERALAAGINYFDTSNNYGDGRFERSTSVLRLMRDRRPTVHRHQGATVDGRSGRSPPASVPSSRPACAA